MNNKPHIKCYLCEDYAQLKTHDIVFIVDNLRYSPPTLIWAEINMKPKSHLTFCGNKFMGYSNQNLLPGYTQSFTFKGREVPNINDTMKFDMMFRVPKSQTNNQ